MKRNISPGLAVAIGAVAVFMVVALLFGFTVVSTEQKEALNVQFDPVAYVDETWPTIQTTIAENAVPLADVLNRIEPDAAGKATKESLTPVAEELGRVTTGEAHVYRVTATGTVTDLDTETSRGTIGLQVDGYEGPIDVRVYVGPRIPSDESSIRDATGFIEFGGFRDQTEFGKVASEINKKVAEGLEKVRADVAEGQQLTLTGAMTIRTFNQPQIDVSTLMIVPIDVTTP
jgi:predicted lipoprotein